MPDTETLELCRTRGYHHALLKPSSSSSVVDQCRSCRMVFFQMPRINCTVSVGFVPGTSNQMHCQCIFSGTLRRKLRARVLFEFHNRRLSGSASPRPRKICRCLGQGPGLVDLVMQEQKSRMQPVRSGHAGTTVNVVASQVWSCGNNTKFAAS